MEILITGEDEVTREPDATAGVPYGPSMIIVVIALVMTIVVTPARADVSFTHEVAPILLKRCTGCHGERANQGGYRAHMFQLLMKAGASSQAPIVPGKPDESRLFKLITATSAAVRMPKSDEPLPPEQIALIRKWIVAGAQFDGANPAASLQDLLGPRQHPVAPASYRMPVPVMALALAPGGNELFVGAYHEILVYNAANGTLVRRLQRLPQRIQSLVFSTDGKQLLVAGGTPGEYGEVSLIDLQRGAAPIQPFDSAQDRPPSPSTSLRTGQLATQPPVRIIDTCNDIVLSAAFSEDGKLVAAGGADATVRLYELANGKKLWTNKVHSDWVTSVSFSFDGRFIASSSKDMTVKVHETQSGALFTTYAGHKRQIGQYKGEHPVYAVRFVGNSPMACSAGGGKWIHLWDPTEAKKESGSAADMEERFAKESHSLHLAHGFQQAVFALTARDGQLFAASADGLMKQFDLKLQKEVRTYSGHTDWIFALDYDAASKRVATGSYNGEVRVWDVETGAVIAAFKAMPTAPG